MVFRVRPVTFDVVTDLPQIIGKLTRGFARSPVLLSDIGEVMVDRARLYASPYRASGQLLGGIKYRVTKDRVLVSSDAPASPFIHEGVVPHWVYRDQISVEGYSVGDWMDSQGLVDRRGRPLWRMRVGIKKSSKPGSRFMEKAYVDGTKYARRRIAKFLKDLNNS